MLIKIGDKEIQGKVAEKSKAKIQYDDALAKGQAAVMLRENKLDKDALKMNIGRLGSKEHAIIQI